MKITIYQAKSPNFGYPSPERPDPVFPDGFEAVAEMEFGNVPVLSALELAYKDTNSIDEPWYEAKTRGLKVLKPARSTSVGDMAIVDDKRYICADVGWKEIVSCSLCGKDVREEDAHYIGSEGDKPRPYCDDCERITEEGDVEER